MKKKPFQIPEAILDQIDECSSGGYILFTLDETGHPEVRSKFDDTVTALGLVRFARSWAKGLDELNGDMISNSLLDENPPDDYFDDDGDED